MLRRERLLILSTGSILVLDGRRLYPDAETVNLSFPLLC